MKNKDWRDRVSSYIVDGTQLNPKRDEILAIIEIDGENTGTNGLLTFIEEVERQAKIEGLEDLSNKLLKSEYSTIRELGIAMSKDINKMIDKLKKENNDNKN